MTCELPLAFADTLNTTLEAWLIHVTLSEARR